MIVNTSHSFSFPLFPQFLFQLNLLSILSRPSITLCCSLSVGWLFSILLTLYFVLQRVKTKDEENTVLKMDLDFVVHGSCICERCCFSLKMRWGEKAKQSEKNGLMKKKSLIQIHCFVRLFSGQGFVCFSMLNYIHEVNVTIRFQPLMDHKHLTARRFLMLHRSTKKIMTTSSSSIKNNH